MPVYGTRLEQLLDLQRQVNLEIQYERRRLALNETPVVSTDHPPITPMPRWAKDLEDQPQEVREVYASASAARIREWARVNGVLCSSRGAIPKSLRLQYACAMYEEQLAA